MTPQHPVGTITLFADGLPIPEGYIHIPADHWIRRANMSLAPALTWSIGDDPEGMKYIYCGPVLPELPAINPNDYSIGTP